MLSSEELAIRRVETRIKEGGHSIPKTVIRRRFKRGLSNLFNLYMPIVDQWIIVDNSEENFKFIAEGAKENMIIKDVPVWEVLKNKYYWS